MAEGAAATRAVRRLGDVRVSDTVTITYLGFDIVLLDETHLTIYAPDGYRLVAGVPMTIRGARNFIRGYRAAERDERTAA